MGTAEILIVFSALMALIALVTIGIDWIGKPLKHRRFIPRLYRFDDEKLPVDEYGNTTFEPAVDNALDESPQPYVVPVPYAQPASHLQLQSAASHAAGRPPVAPMAAHDQANPTVVVPAQAPPRQVAQLDPAVAATATASRSAFTDSLGDVESEPQSPTSADDETNLFPHSTIAGTGLAAAASSAERSWNSGMTLDTTVDDEKPSLAIKAERFWIASAEASRDSHFDQDDLDRMANGKAPRRTNPRNGKTEAMQLTGLRQASERGDVRMRWPDDSVDPWSAS